MVGGQRLDALGATATPWTAVVDGSAALLGALAIWGSTSSQTGPGGHGAISSRPPTDLRAALGVVIAVCGVAHAAEFSGVAASLAVLVVSLFVAQRGGGESGVMLTRRFALFCGASSVSR